MLMKNTRKTTKLLEETVQQRINQVHHGNIKMENYVKASALADFTCLVCGYKWETTPRSVYYLKSGCSRCSNNEKITTTEMQSRMEELVGDAYTLLSECKGRHKKVKLRHNECGNEYWVEAGSFLLGKRCPNETGKRISQALTTTGEEMINQLQKSWGGEFQYVSGFENVNDDAIFRHAECGKTFRARPRQLIKKVRACTFCSSSKGEKMIQKYLEKNDIEYVSQYSFKDCRDIYPLPFDFAIFDFKNTLKYLIEYQGGQHYALVDYFGSDSFLNTVKHDDMKKDYCAQHDITLLCIPVPKKNVNLDKLYEYISNYLDYHMSIPNQA